MRLSHKICDMETPVGRLTGVFVWNKKFFYRVLSNFIKEKAWEREKRGIENLF